MIALASKQIIRSGLNSSIKKNSLFNFAFLFNESSLKPVMEILSFCVLIFSVEQKIIVSYPFEEILDPNFQYILSSNGGWPTVKSAIFFVI